MTHSARYTAAALVFAAAAMPLRGPAAPAGLAYDSVTKLLQTGDGTAPQPGNFPSDFQTASASPPPAPKLPFGLGKMAGSLQSIQSMMQNGIAERHYIGTTKERTDNVPSGTADITDCTARTLTHLDLNAKTYTVSSLDQQQAAQTSTRMGGGPGPAPTDDGSKLAIDMKTRALGPRKLEGVATDGYDMNMKVTTTKPNGDSSTFDTVLTSYVSGLAEPNFRCAVPSAVSPGGMAMPGGAAYSLILKALSQKGNPRFTVTNAGPPVPSGKLSMWQVMALQGGRGGAFQIETEKGNVRAIGDSDPAFTVPPDFKKI